MKVGSVVRPTIIRDKETGQSKGYAFVEFMLSIKADEAISTCNKKEFKGQQLNIRHYGAPEQPRQDPKELRENLMQTYHQVMVRGINKKLSIKQAEAQLKETFGAIGTVSNIKIPKQKNGPSHKHDGYGFVEFLKEKHARRAVELHHSKSAKFRCSMKLPRDEYLQMKKDKKIQRQKEQEEADDSENEEFDDAPEEEEEDLPEREAGDLLEDLSDEEDEQMQDDDEEESEEEEEEKEKTYRKDDLRRTIFIKNLPYDIDKESLRELFEEKYGRVQYVAPVPNKETGLSNGTAFLKFKFDDTMQRLMDDVELASRLSNVDKKGGKAKEVVKPGEVSGLEIDGRKLNISRAIPKDSADDINKQKTQQTLKDRDKRNLYLMMEGHVSKESDAAKTMPENHLRKIEANFQAKKKKLDNPIFHVSRTRLAVQNLPKTMDVKALRELFMEHAQDEEHGAPVIKQCKIVHEKDPNLKNVELGSKGFGFVEFTKHEHALKALRELNNNPNIFESENPADKKIKRKRAALEVNNNRRLIVEFAVENTMKLHKLKEHMAKSNRTKEDKEKMQRQLQADSKLKTKKRKFDDVGGKKRAPKGQKPQKRRKK